MKTNTLGTIAKEHIRQQKIAQKAMKKALELKAFREAMAAQKAEELRIQNTVNKIAKSLSDPMRKVTVESTGDFTDFSAARLCQEFSTKLSITDSVWAPWSKFFK